MIDWLFAHPMSHYPSGALYFFSSLAQCAAAFAALLAVFATFKLQSDSSLLIQRHQQAVDWGHRVGFLNQYDPTDIGFVLGKLKHEIEQRNSNSSFAKELFEEIEKLVKSSTEIPRDLALPSWHWAVLFLTALVSIAVFSLTHFQYRILFLAAIGGQIGWIFWTLLLTRDFVQKCLRVKTRR